MAPGIPAALERPHFIGIGGAGMSGIAKILAQRGAKVAGSDARESATADALRALGATVHIGHAAGHLADDATSVVVSSAIRADNPELVRAAELDIPVVHRSDALASLMDGLRSIAVAGTHGKTTTTSMLAVALSSLSLGPSYAIGGDLEGPGTNATHGEGDIFVAEADESDRSFQKYDPEVAIVLNVELDHHANYASMDEIHESFEAFTDKIVPGGHYALNAVAALAAGVALGIPAHNLASALGKYTGVKRRLQLKGEAAGVQVIDSYAHPPTEMTADLEAMRGAASESRLLVVFQPHLFSRTQELGTEMGQALALADASLVLDIYPAREDPLPGVTSALIIDAAKAAGADVTAVHDKAAVPAAVAGMAKPGDLVLTMGAGDVTDLGPRILDHLSSGR